MATFLSYGDRLSFGKQITLSSKHICVSFTFAFWLIYLKEQKRGIFLTNLVDNRMTILTWSAVCQISAFIFPRFFFFLLINHNNIALTVLLSSGEIFVCLHR